MTQSNTEDLYIQIDQLRQSNQQAIEYGLELYSEKELLEYQYRELENQYELIKKEFEKVKNQYKTQNEEILTTEETLFNEKQKREEYLLNEITHKDDELRLLKQDYECIFNENENNLSNSKRLTEENQQLTELIIQLKQYFKESKQEEERLVEINTGLQYDNVTLQQQVQRLREYRTNYENLQIENKQLQDTIDDLHQTLKELEGLKIIAESQLIELHTTLRDEREQKHSYKQQLDHRIQRETLRNLDSLCMTLNDEYDYDEEDTSDFRSSIDLSDTSEFDQKTDNLFSEIHRKLEVECLQLSQIKVSLDNQLSGINEKTKILSNKLQHIIQKLHPDKISSTEPIFDDTDNLLTTSLDSTEQIEIFLHKNLNEQELLKTKATEQEHLISKLRQDLNVMFTKTEHNMLDISEELKNYRSYMFTSTGISNDIQNERGLIDGTLYDIIQQQIKQLKQSFDYINKRKEQAPTHDNLPNDTPELQNQIIKLRKSLTRQREQNTSLRTSLKVQGETAEIALATLKTTYENEKLSTNDHLTKLRDQLRLYKEDALTSSTLRTIFNARSDEYKTQINELQEQIHLANEEKKTLNTLLLMAMQQKVLLTQKLNTQQSTNQPSNDNNNIINNQSMPATRRERFIPPRMMQAFETSKYHQIHNRR